MANVKISDLPNATVPLVGTEPVEIIQDGISKQVLSADLVSIIVSDDFIVGTSTDDPSMAAGTFDAVLTYLNANLADTATVGFSPAGDNFRIQNLAEGGFHQLAIRDGTVLVETIAAASGGLLANNQSTGGGLERVLTTADISVTPALGGLTDVTLTAPATGAVLYKSAGDWLDTPGILIDPAADVKLHQATVEVFRTLGAAAGGAEANNTLTGAGFERVLTEADAFTGIIQGSSTDSPETPGGTWDGVLRFDNANDLQTARVGFDPAGDTFYVQPTVEGGRLILGGRSPGAPGVLREVIVIDFDTGALPAGSMIFSEPNGTADLMRLDTGVSSVTGIGNVLNQPSGGFAQVGGFRVQNVNASPEISMFVGFNESIGQTELEIKNFVHGGAIQLLAETAAGVERLLFFTDPDQRGPIIFGLNDNTPVTPGNAQDARMTFRNPSAENVWQIGFIDTDDDLIWKSFQRSGDLDIRGTDSGGTERIVFLANPNGAAGLYQVGVEVARTLTAAAGGFEANNTLTGAGFERVLTTADIFGGALNDLSDVTLTTPATGAVLYKSAGNWLDTPAITIDPAAAIQLFHAGVGTPKFRTTANGFDMLGDTSTNSDFDLYSLDGATLRAAIRTDGAGLRLESQVNSLSVTIFARSGAGALNAGLQVTGSTGITQLYFSAAIKLLTQSQGITVRGNAANNVQLLLEGSSGIDHFQINAVGSNITFNSTIDGSSMRFTGEDNGSVNRLMLDMDPDGEVNLYRVGARRAGTRFDGFTIFGLLANNPATGGTQDVSLNLESSVGALAGAIRYTTSTDMRLENFVHGGSILVLAEDSGGTLRFLLDMDPTGPNSVQLHEVGVSVARTATAALGGLFANNTLTGAGFERVLTVADRTSAAAYTPTNVVTTRTYDANATSIDEIADVLGTLIADLQAINVIQ